MTWKRFGLSLIFPVSFTVAIYSHLKHPWLPRVFGDLPYHEAITVAFMIWSFHLYSQTRTRVGRRRVACLRCREVFTLSQWRSRGVCPACLHHEHEAVQVLPPAPDPRKRQPTNPAAWRPSGRMVSPVEMGSPRLSMNEKKRVKGRLDRVAGVPVSRDRME